MKQLLYFLNPIERSLICTPLQRSCCHRAKVAKKLIFHNSTIEMLRFSKSIVKAFGGRGIGSSSNNYIPINSILENNSKLKASTTHFRFQSGSSTTSQNGNSKSKLNNNAIIILDKKSFHCEIEEYPIDRNGVFWKTTLFTAIVTGAALMYVHSESGIKRRREKLAKERSQTIKGRGSSWWGQLRPEEKAVAQVIGVNALVYLGWLAASANPTLRVFMWRNFTLHPAALNTYVPHTMLTSAFSHQGLAHFAFNMIGLWSFGTTIYREAGSEPFYLLYGAGAVFSAWGSVLFKLRTRSMIPSLGASGAVFAIATAAVTLHPDMQLSFIFLPFIPITGSTLLTALFGWECFGMFATARGIMNLGLDHAGHAAGMVFGYSYIKWLKARQKSRRALQQNNNR